MSGEKSGAGPAWLTDLTVVDRELADRLRAAGLHSVEHVAAATKEQLREVDGISRGVAARIQAETRHVEPGDDVREEVNERRGDDAAEERGAEPEPDLEQVTDIAGVDRALAWRLRDAGFETVADVATARLEQLQAVDGVNRGLAARLRAETAVWYMELSTDE